MTEPDISGFRVGAVGRSRRGSHHLGYNMESFGGTLSETVHAEVAAVVNAACAEEELVELWVDAPPCGHCRHFLSVHAPQVVLHFSDRSMPLSELFSPPAEAPLRSEDRLSLFLAGGDRISGFRLTGTGSCPVASEVQVARIRSRSPNDTRAMFRLGDGIPEKKTPRARGSRTSCTEAFPARTGSQRGALLRRIGRLLPCGSTRLRGARCRSVRPFGYQTPTSIRCKLP
ncbi:MAG: hypothetical protein HC923_02850 [Myxococcales bacterium]|nr:hypothetical protein [Myxococcales bacterium]